MILSHFYFCSITISLLIFLPTIIPFYLCRGLVGLFRHLSFLSGQNDTVLARHVYHMFLFLLFMVPFDSLISP